MWNHVDAWKAAASRLGVLVTGPVTVRLSEGVTISADILFHCFGAPKGTLVFANSQVARQYERQLISEGYTYSEFLPPHEGYIYSEAELTELLKDWTWCGPEDSTPTWLRIG